MMCVMIEVRVAFAVVVSRELTSQRLSFAAFWLMPSAKKKKVDLIFNSVENFYKNMFYRTRSSRCETGKQFTE